VGNIDQPLARGLVDDGRRGPEHLAAGRPRHLARRVRGQPFEDKGEVIESQPPRRLVHTHFSALSGGEDVPENYHRLAWTLRPEDGATKLTLVQSGASSAAEAEQFKASWAQMLDALREAAES
jgi:uncharacterized protein YndB with AHSA1/START domain